MNAIICAGIIMLASVSMASAEICTGKWGGQSKTSVTFKKGDKVRYCFKAQCYNEEFVGDKKKKIMFSLGNSGATVTLVASGRGYKAKWRNGNNSARATLKCK